MNNKNRQTDVNLTTNNTDRNVDYDDVNAVPMLMVCSANVNMYLPAYFGLAILLATLPALAIMLTISVDCGPQVVVMTCYMSHCDTVLQERSYCYTRHHT